jgi:energy-coupling factor transporter ATP-binding protein EcfA2
MTIETKLTPISSPSPVAEPKNGAKTAVTAEMQDALERFKQARVRHPALQATLKDLLLHIRSPDSENILVLTGVTGVGKTTANEALQTALYNEFREDIERNPGLLPVVTVEAGQSGDQKQGFKGLYRRMLTVMNEYDPDRGAAVIQKDGHLWLNAQARRTTEGMRNVLESALRHRQTKALVIDEASHLLSMARSAALMDTLKSLANTVGCKIVLIGSFDLLDIIVQSGQVCRRTNVFALQRYKDNTEDRAAFRFVVRRLMQAWPCETVPAFDAVSDELREVTFGAVGLLKTLLTNVLTQQLQAHGVFSPHMLQSAVKSPALRESIRLELERGEAKLASAAYGGGAWTDAAFAKMVEKMEG